MVRRCSLPLALLLACCTASALTRGDLIAKYGRSTWKQTADRGAVTAEQFVPEPGVALSARYDEHGRVTEVRIVPLGAESDEHGTRSLRADLAERILNQLVPRKRQPPESVNQTTGACHHATQAMNDELTILREFSDCDPKGLNLTLTWR